MRRRAWVAAAILTALLAGSAPDLGAQVGAAARGVGKVKADAAAPIGTRRALVVGISNYKNVAHLQFAAADAISFAAFLRSPAGGSVPVGNIRLRLDSAATRTQLLGDVMWLQGESHANDEVVIYFAGHGDVEPITGNELGFLLAYDARAGRDYFPDGAIKVTDLMDLISAIVKKPAKVLLITDACRSGKLVPGHADAPAATAALMQAWNGVATLVSSGPTELSQEGPLWHGHGVFTYYLLKGLTGLANLDSDTVVTAEEVGRFVQDSVKEATQSQQTPARFGDLTAHVAAWVRRPATPVAAAGTRGLAGAPSADAEPTDSSVLSALAAFRHAVQIGALLKPEGTSAWDVYQQLLGNPAAASVSFTVLTDLRTALQEDAQQVIADYAMGGDRHPDAERIREAATELARVSELMPKTSVLVPQVQARRLFLEGYAYMQKGDFVSALPPLRASIALEPQAAYAYDELGFAFLASNQLDSARYAFGIARHQARRSYPLLGLALVTLDAGDAAGALALVDSALTVSAPQVSLHLVRALALLELGRRAETIAAFGEARKLDRQVADDTHLHDLLSYSPGIVARVPRLRAVVR